MKKFSSILGTVSLLALFGASPAPVKVVYAGSLVTPMEGAVGPAFSLVCRCSYEGEGKGSVALVKMIEGGVRDPDVFVSADSRLMGELLHPAGRAPFIAQYTIFGAAHLVVGYSPKSAFAGRFERVAAGKGSLTALLRTTGLRIGRTDPRLDPKGVRTISALRSLGLDPDLGEVFPEEDLLVRLESGDLDAAFLYSTESRSRHIPAATLPARAKYDPITYSIAALRAAGNPRGARAFLEFVLHGPGKAMLENAGVSFIKPAVIQK